MRDELYGFESPIDGIQAFCKAAGLYGSLHCRFLSEVAQKVEGQIQILTLYKESYALALEEEKSEGVHFFQSITYQLDGSIEGLRWVTGTSKTEITFELATNDRPRSYVRVRNTHSKKEKNDEGQSVDPSRSFKERTEAVEKFMASKQLVR